MTPEPQSCEPFTIIILNTHKERRSVQLSFKNHMTFERLGFEKEI